MAYRATKSGLSAEAQQKLQAKYDSEAASQCLQWIQALLQRDGQDASFSTSGDTNNFHQVLENGLYLGKLSNVLMPGSIQAKKLAKAPTLPFKKMELIGEFVTAIKSGYGVPDHEAFQTVDLFEEQNLHQVVICLQTLSRKAQAKGHLGFGPKEAEANKRNFTDEQLKAGQGVIGLQMGTNKGANQSGMNIGNTRHIVD